ncbi:MAG: apolipoprotein N-acyltransferase [Thalassovita sp.]
MARLPLIVRLLPLGALGAVAGLGQAPFELWPVTMVAFGVMAVVLSRTQHWRLAAWQGWAIGTGYFALSLIWIVQPFLVDPLRHGWMAPFALIFMSGGLALFWALGFAVAQVLGRNILALAGALTLAEIIRSYIFTGFPWALPGHVLADTPLAQMAVWGGAHGLGLLVMLGAMAVAGVWHRQWVQVLLGVGLLAGAWVWGAARLEVTAVAADGPVLRLIQPNAPQHQKWDPAYTPIFFQRQVGFSAAPSDQRRPDLIVWPETAVPVALGDADRVFAHIAEVAQAPVLLGIQRFEGAQMFNSAVLLGQGGAVQQIYDKHHLVPFGEYLPFGDLLSDFGLKGFAARDGNGFAAGPGPRLLDLGPEIGKALPLICYEAVFPNDILAAPDQPALLLQITNDAWFGTFSGPYQHLAQARLRAIEQGLPLARAANTGVSAMIDPLGRVTAQIPLGQAGFVDAVLPKPGHPTLYRQTGDWAVLALSWLLLVASALGPGRPSRRNAR